MLCHTINLYSADIDYNLNPIFGLVWHETREYRPGDSIVKLGRFNHICSIAIKRSNTNRTHQETLLGICKVYSSRYHFGSFLPRVSVSAATHFFAKKKVTDMTQTGREDQLF